MYKLSIIVPIYNVEKYIRECLESILEQITPDVEVICINDGTLDMSMDIARSMLNEYSMDIQTQFVFVDQKNKGLSGARNTGIAIAKGDYISFLDSDDKILPDYFAHLLPMIDENNYDIIDFDLINSNDELLSTRKYTEEDVSDTNSIFRAGNWFCCCRAFKKDIIGKSRFVPSIYYEDLAFTPSIYLKAKNTIHLDVPVYWYRLNQEGITLTFSKKGNLKTIESFEYILNLYLDKYERTNNSHFQTVAVQTYFLLCANACRRLGLKKSLYLYYKYKRDLNKLVCKDSVLDADILSSRIKYFYRSPKSYLILYSLYCKLRYDLNGK